MRDGTDGGLTIVLDENLSGRRIIAGLRNAGIPVKPQTDFLKRGSTDEQVLTVLSRHPGCLLLSKDSDFHRKPAVRNALIRHGVGAFIITAHKNKTADELVALVRAAWPRMERCARKWPRPFIAKITADGTVTLIPPVRT